MPYKFANNLLYNRKEAEEDKTFSAFLCIKMNYVQRNAEWHISRTSKGVTAKFSRPCVKILCREGENPPTKKSRHEY